MGVVLASSVGGPVDAAVASSVAVPATGAVAATVDAALAVRLGTSVALPCEVLRVAVNEAEAVAVDDGLAVGDGLGVGSAVSVLKADGEGLGEMAVIEVVAALGVSVPGPAATAGGDDPRLNRIGRITRNSPAIKTTAAAATVAMAQTGSRL